VPGSVAAQLAVHGRNAGTIAIEHPAGRIETRVEVDPTGTADDFVILRAGVVRTARLLLSGQVFVNVAADLAAAA
jgi:2-methylaconitate cis-trans-isomerase PrpF